jgi:hypothetical protein
MIDVGDLVLWKKHASTNDRPGLVLRKEVMGNNAGFWILWPDDHVAWSPSILLKTVRGITHGEHEAKATTASSR